MMIKVVESDSYNNKRVSLLAAQAAGRGTCLCMRNYPHKTPAAIIRPLAVVWCRQRIVQLDSISFVRLSTQTYGFHCFALFCCACCQMIHNDESTAHEIQWRPVGLLLLCWCARFNANCGRTIFGARSVACSLAPANYFA